MPPAARRGRRSVPWIADLDWGFESKIQNRKSKIAPADATSYLETDQTTNVRFYQRFGYQVVGQEPVLGITTWSMERLANSASEIP
jgi:hypothetical protein